MNTDLKRDTYYLSKLLFQQNYKKKNHKTRKELSDKNKLKRSVSNLFYNIINSNFSEHLTLFES